MAAIDLAVEKPLQPPPGDNDPPAETQRRKLPPGHELVRMGPRDPQGRRSLGHGQDETLVRVHEVTSENGADKAGEAICRIPTRDRNWDHNWDLTRDLTRDPADLPRSGTRDLSLN